jgi:cytochrome b6-f complex iron-sulfur subunit
MNIDNSNSDSTREDGQNNVSPQNPPVPPQHVTPTPQKPADISGQPIVRQTAGTVEVAAASDSAMERRTFIKWLAIGWTAFAAVVAGYGTLFLRFLFPNVLFEPKQSFLAGFPEDYEVGKVSERFKGKHAVWIVRDTEKLYVLSTVCTHLGCTPNWLENDNKFKCPCHGSGFYKTGINFEGPAPRPLERFKVELNDEGEILVDKTKKFQQEKGEWNDPESYLLV